MNILSVTVNYLKNNKNGGKNRIGKKILLLPPYKPVASSLYTRIRAGGLNFRAHLTGKTEAITISFETGKHRSFACCLDY